MNGGWFNMGIPIAIPLEATGGTQPGGIPIRGGSPMFKFKFKGGMTAGLVVRVVLEEAPESSGGFLGDLLALLAPSSSALAGVAALPSNSMGSCLTATKPLGTPEGLPLLLFAPKPCTTLGIPPCPELASKDATA